MVCKADGAMPSALVCECMNVIQLWSRPLAGHGLQELLCCLPIKNKQLIGAVMPIKNKQLIDNVMLASILSCPSKINGS